MFTVPDLKERLLELLFEPEQRSYDRGAFEYDACVNGVFVLSHLDGDIARLVRFKEAVERRPEHCEVLCFELADIRILDRAVVESELKVRRRDVLEET